LGKLWTATKSIVLGLFLIGAGYYLVTIGAYEYGGGGTWYFIPVYYYGGYAAIILGIISIVGGIVWIFVPRKEKEIRIEDES
jgi:hypothetical protein